MSSLGQQSLTIFYILKSSREHGLNSAFLSDYKNKLNYHLCFFCTLAEGIASVYQCFTKLKCTFLTFVRREFRHNFAGMLEGKSFLLMF